MADDADPTDVLKTLQGKSTLDPVLNKLESLDTQRAATDKEGADVAKQTRAENDRSRKVNADVERDHPFVTPDTKPWTEKPPENNPVRDFGSWASTLGILASALTHTPLTSALNASASAMKAAQTGDLNAYKDAKDAWKSNTELAMKQADWENKRYDHAMELADKDHALALSTIQTYAVEHQDKVMSLAAQAGDWEKIGTIMQARQAMADKAQDQFMKWSDFTDEQQDKMRKNAFVKDFATQQAGEWAKAHPGQKPTDQQIKAWEYAGKLSSITEESKAQWAGRTGSSAGVGLSSDAQDLDAFNRLFNGKYPPGMGNTKDKEAVDNRAAEIAQSLGMSMAEASSLPAEKRADAASLLQMTKWRDGVDRGSETVDKNLDLASEYRAKLPFSKIQMANNAMLSGLTEVGDPDAQIYLNLMTEAAMEYGRVMAGPTSNAMLPVGIATQQLHRMATGMSDSQFAGERIAMNKSMANQISSSDNVITKRRDSLHSLGGSSRATSVEGSAPQIPEGIDPSLWQHMTPEEQALWQK